MTCVINPQDTDGKGELAPFAWV